MLALPQLMRRQFERIIDPMVMRRFRIAAGPTAIIIQLQSHNIYSLFIKLCLSFGGLTFVPDKNTDSYSHDRKIHGRYMAALFLVNSLELLCWGVSSPF
jgi:hypothetical protein